MNQTILITGGAGFIGTNLADRLASQGERVLVFDSLARPGSDHNLAWLMRKHGDLIRVQIADVRDTDAVAGAVRQANRVFHMAAQVAVTTSLTDPLDDFEVNVQGTLNVLEAARSASRPPALLFTSTNKVYGDLSDIQLRTSGRRYEPLDASVRCYGINESRPLSFHSPFGCSKGSADQYVLDYARNYGLEAAVFRMSCIYGVHQFGNEDQGWVAHFLNSVLKGQKITVYGDGRQVRDLLFVDDLMDAMIMAMDRMDVVRGQVFNIGGGPELTGSLLEIMQVIEGVHEARSDYAFGPWRPGDPRYYVSDTRSFSKLTGWQPRVTIPEGVSRVYRWMQDNRAAMDAVSAERAWMGGDARIFQVRELAS